MPFCNFFKRNTLIRFHFLLLYHTHNIVMVYFGGFHAFWPPIDLKNVVVFYVITAISKQFFAK